MSDRHTADTINDDALDQLYDRLAALHAGEEDGYDPLTVPTPGQWIHEFNRATPARRLEVVAATTEAAEKGRQCFFMGHEKRLADEQHAWVALARVRDVIADMERITGARHWARILRLAVDGEPDPPSGPAATGHVYLSTSCLHNDHAYCQSMTGLNGAKRPGECKKCQAKCICGCHQQTTPATPTVCPACTRADQAGLAPDEQHPHCRTTTEH